MKPLAVGLVALVALLLTSSFVAATPASPLPAASRTFTLYGSVSPAAGWGLSSTAIQQPGPTLYVEAGDSVTLHLYAADGVTHNWTIDFNNNTQVNAGEIFSPNFSSSTTAVDFTFTVPANRVGTWTYRCGLHPTAMTGLIVILGPPTFTLYGSASPTSGWGNTSTTITNPGPTLVVNQGDTVSLDLYSVDGVAHTFFVDWNKNGVFDSGTETQSRTFSSSTVPLRFNFTASLAGAFTFYCGIHGTSMKGTLVVKGPTTPPAGGPDYTIYAAVIVVIVVVAIAVAVLMRRKPRAPPEQPPAQPPQQG